MEDEIDLRPYIDSLRRRWVWIVLSTALFGVFAFTVSSFITPTYEATALVVVEPNDVVQFDSRFRDASDSQPLKALPELAISDELLQSVLTQLSLDNVNHVQQLRQIVQANSGQDASVIRLTVSYNDPQLAAQIATIWANEFIIRANDIFNDFDGEQVQFYQSQLIEAEEKLLALENELIAFQSENRSSVISNTLQAFNQRQIDFLAAQADLALLQQDVQSLHNLLISTSSNNFVTFADQLAALTLQLRLFNLETAVPLQIQINESTTLVTENRAEQISIVETWLEILEAQIELVNEELDNIEPLILSLQQEGEIVNSEYKRLMQRLLVAQETHTALALKVEEEKISSQNINQGISLASKASIPGAPTSPNKLSNTIIGTMLGFILATFLIITNQWWQSYKQG